MAASDDFARGWDAFSGLIAPSTAATLSIPAAPGINHALTAVNLTLAGTTSAPASSGPIEVFANVGNGAIRLGWASIPPINGVTLFQWSGKLPGVLGAMAQVTTDTLPTNTYGQMEMTGYDN